MALDAEEILEGTIEHIVYQNSQTFWTVARLRLPRKPEPVTVVGNLVHVQEGTPLKLTGTWKIDRKYGQQFAVRTCQTITPKTVLGIERYLGSGVVPGIGPELAKRMVKKFGDKTLDVIAAEPNRLAEIPGIGRVRAAQIQESLQATRDAEEVMVFLQGNGITTAQALRIYKEYGSAAVGIVKANPYRLALDVWGIGFRTADAIAQSLGLERNSRERAEAGVLHILGEQVGEGHVHVPEKELIKCAIEALDIDEEIIRTAADGMVATGRLVKETLGERGECLYLRSMWQAETRAAMSLSQLLAGETRPLARHIDRRLTAFEKAHGITLAAEQREAIRAAVTEKVVVITGGPGVGKTTIVKAILALVGQEHEAALGAPTGRAAKRLAETTGRSAMTLHRLLEFNPRSGIFQRNESAPLEAELMVVDETSMLDILLFAHLLAALRSSARLVLVGDVDQLPSVGPGAVLKDVIASGKVKVIRLKEIFRQARESAIVVNAHRVNEGELPDIARAPDSSDFFLVERDEPLEVRDTLLTLVTERIPRRFGLDPINDVQVLSPMHRGDAGTQSLNVELQARLNPPRPGLGEISRMGRTYRVGDKVMQVKNDYEKEVFNGDIGRILAINSKDESPTIVVAIDDREVAYELSEIDKLVHAFAQTVHKSQGSEYPAVVIPLCTQHYMMLERNLLYTAITRGKRLVVIVGSRRALAIAVKQGEKRRRWTWLAERL